MVNSPAYLIWRVVQFFVDGWEAILGWFMGDTSYLEPHRGARGQESPRRCLCCGRSPGAGDACQRCGAPVPRKAS
jgi:hypothetical protein